MKKIYKKILGWLIVGSFLLTMLYGYWLAGGWTAIVAIFIIFVLAAVVAFGVTLIIE